MLTSLRLFITNIFVKISFLHNSSQYKLFPFYIGISWPEAKELCLSTILFECKKMSIMQNCPFVLDIVRLAIVFCYQPHNMAGNNWAISHKLYSYDKSWELKKIWRVFLASPSAPHSVVSLFSDYCSLLESLQSGIGPLVSANRRKL